MDTLQPFSFLVLDKPVLGVWAAVACLAGGAATQNMAGASLPVGQVGFTPGWESGAPTHPARALAAIPRPMAPVPVLHKVGQAALKTSPRLVPIAVSAPTLPAARVELAASATPLEPAAPLTETARPLGVAATPEPASLAEPVSPAAIAPALPRGELPGLINRAEFKSFDLARVAGSRGPGTTELVPAARSRPLGATATGSGSPGKDRVLDESLIHVTGVTLGGHSAGTIDVRIGADMKPSVKVGDLLALVASQMDPDTVARLSVASGASEYVSFTTLRAAGFDVSYSAGSDSISIDVGL